MKKNILLFLLMVFIFPLEVDAINFEFNKDMLFEKNSTSKISDSLDKKYAIESVKDNDNEEFVELTKKATYLLIGNGEEESSREFYSRKKEFKSISYNPKLPDNISEDDPLYQDASYALYHLPNMFNLVNDLNIRYDYFGNIKTGVINENQFVSRIYIPNVTLQDTDEDNPRKYKELKTNLNIFYIFKKDKDEFKLFFINIEETSEINEYVKKSKSSENKGIYSINSISDISSDLYDFTKLNSLTKKDLDNVYNSNVAKFMRLNAYSKNDLSTNGSGFMLTNDILVTSWSYIKNCLMNSKEISVVDYKSKIYDIDGIVSINEESDLVLIKIKGYNNGGVVIGGSDKLEIEDPIISLGTKTGYGISSTSSIVISNNDDIQMLLPIIDSDIGGPLFNKEGKLVGIINNKAILSSNSYATKVTNLKELQDKFNSEKDIKIVSLKDIQDNYYYMSKNEENIKKNIPDKIWSKVSSIGGADSISLPLIKSSYKNNVVSLRYDNKVNSFISNTIFINNIKNNLKDNNYKKVLDTNNKIIYENKNYKVLAMNEFNYLIVLLVIK